MKKINLTGTDLQVSRACFGTMTFGKPVNDELAEVMVNACLEAGINFFDTANVYQQGLSETMLGNALVGRRQQVIIASKVRGKMTDAPEQSGLAKTAIVNAVEASLQRLRTDYLDIYYLHQPDYEVPIEESLAAMEALVKQGKVRYVASSNYSSWQSLQMLWLAEQRQYQPVKIAQQMYNLLARGLEPEYIPLAKQFGISLIVYNPLAGGLLTGKHQPQVIAPGTRFDNNQMYQDRYWHPQFFEAVEQLKLIAQNAGRSLVGLAMSWLLHHTATGCVIIGASRLEHLQQNIAACYESTLTAEVVAACDEVWRELRGPIPQYNR